MTKIWPLQSDLAAMHAAFGNPDANNDGAPDPSWAAKWLTTIIPPFSMHYDSAPVRRITVNKGCADALLAALSDISQHPEFKSYPGISNFGGLYNFRKKRGGSSLSMHSYGVAIDLDPEHNPFRGHTKTMPQWVVDIFKKYGASWGGDWSAGSYDPMHFQFARVH